MIFHNMGINNPEIKTEIDPTAQAKVILLPPDEKKESDDQEYSRGLWQTRHLQAGPRITTYRFHNRIAEQVLYGGKVPHREVQP